MLTEIKVKHINGLRDAKVKFGEMGDLSYLLTFDVLLDPGDLGRILILFKQRIPVNLSISSPQSKMDLKVNLISDTAVEEKPVVDPTTLEETKERVGATAGAGGKGGKRKE